VIYAGDGEFRENRELWLQPSQYWTAIYYHHSNAAIINARTFAVPADSICLFPPATRAGHTLIGDGTNHMFITFDLPAESGKRYALPHLISPAINHYSGFRHAVNLVSGDTLPAKSFIWNLLVSISLDPSTLRQHEALYAAEDFILRHLSESLRIPQIAEAAKISPRQLLRMFREEHRMTVQEFLRAKRTQEACRLLITTHRPIKVIAEQVGIPDLAQFNKLIRSETGTAPRVYREMALKK
jgi:AraC-like DNA-binding protein